MASSSPFFSVIVTTYNRASLLPRALGSLIAQTEKDWEAIVIDDGSRDNTQSLLEEWTGKYPKLHYYYKENGGVASAKNKGLAMAKGDFLTFLDSDDEYKPEHLALRKQFIADHPKTQFLHGGVDVRGNQFVPDYLNLKRRIPVSECSVSGTFFISKGVYAKIGGFENMPIGSDAEFMERIEQKGIEVNHVNYPTYVYHRESEDSVTQKMRG